MSPFKPFLTGREDIYKPFRSIYDVLAPTPELIQPVVEAQPLQEAIRNSILKDNLVSNYGAPEVSPGFSASESLGSGLVLSGAVKLFSQALEELFGGKRHKVQPKTFTDLYKDSIAAMPARTSYLEEAMKPKK